MTTLRELQREVHQLAREKGWWDGVEPGDHKAAPELKLWEKRGASAQGYER